jgi:aminopeptidase-like protein
MKNKINVNNIADSKKITTLINKLYPICRSITGKGFTDSLKILQENMEIKLSKFKTGSKVLDWTIPKEWNIKDAYVVDPDGKKIIDFKKHNLHVVNYSIPVNKIISLNELKKKLFTLPKQPNAIPYITSYYKKDWGFCIEYNKFKKLKKGNYKVFIDSSLKNGNLIYSDSIIPGKSKKQILLSTYLCHPQMANHELGGPIVLSLLYKILKKTGPHKYTYRFLVCPENIGSAAFLHKNKSKLKNIKAGYIINCVGKGDEVTYKKSRISNSLSDKAAINVIKNFGKNFIIEDFYPWGSDERQFCSPGFNLPIGLIMRKRFDKFKEYHTSLDNKKFVSSKTLIETINIYHQVLMTIENDFTPLAKVIYGTPQLSKSKIPLYRTKMNWKLKGMDKRTKSMLQILNLADGKRNLLDIANDKGFKLIDHIDLIKDLLESGYIRKV